MEDVDHKVSLIPDFISNCAMASVFAYLMEKKVHMTDEAIFLNTSKTITKAIKRTYQLNPSNTNISAIAFENALKQFT